MTGTASKRTRKQPVYRRSPFPAGSIWKGLSNTNTSITTQDLDNWLRGLKINPRNRRNFRTLLDALFNFAREQGYRLLNDDSKESADIS